MENTNTSKKKKLTAAAAIILAIALLFGGTYAYLQATSDEVTNIFATNQVSVDLTETGTDENGENQYNIVPGTGETKDPTVTLTTSVDAYVFVEITDATVLDDGTKLVDWAIDEGEGWTLYDTTTDEGGNTVYIYYQLYTVASEGTEETIDLGVLLDDYVTYSYLLTNEDMAAAEEQYPEGVKLSFVAYAIQAEPFDTVATAYIVATGNTAEVADTTALTEAIEAGDVVTLTSDIDLGDDYSVLTTASSQYLQEDVVIDLNGYTLSYEGGSIVATEDASLYIANGTLDISAAEGTNQAYSSVLGAEAGGSVTLNNVTVNSDSSVLYPRGDAATVNVLNSTINAAGYGVATNAETVDNYGVVINIVNSTVTTSTDNGDNCAVMINVAGTLNIDNSTITGNRQAVVVRAGTATITDSNLVLNGTYDKPTQYYTSNWGSGNEVPAAALVVGNQKGSYLADAVCTLTDSNVTTTDGYALVYIDGNSAYSATLTATGVNFTADDVTEGQNSGCYSYTVE